MQDMKRGLAAPLLFLGLALAAFGSVHALPALWLATLVALALAHVCLPATAAKRTWGSVGVAVLLFAGWLVVENRWLSPSYSAAGTFHAAFLAAGYAVGRRAAGESTRTLFHVALAFGACIAGWALWQRVGGVARAQALFETPATMTAAINLVLLPAIVVRVSGRGGFTLASLVSVLMAGLVAADSRGGWLAFAAGLLAASVVMRHAGVVVDRRSLRTVAYAIVAGWVLGWVSQFAPDALALLPGGGPERAAELRHSMLSADAVRSGVARLSLYELALRSIEPSTLFSGAGYLAFYYVLESVRLDIPSFENSISYFVHNDYLQTLFELGLPGFAGLFAVVALPLLAAWQSMALLPDPKERLALCALWAALASMAAHAMVDFPFYIPVCLLLYGMGSGVIARLSSQTVASSPLLKEHVPEAFGRAAYAASATLVAWLVLTPVAAQAAAANAHRHWRAGDGEKAAYWFEFARRTDPRDWRYHWYAGQFWFLQAGQSRKLEAAALADRAFSDGVAANPREVRNVVGRLATHRELRGLLAQPASAERMRQWARLAIELSPYDRGVQREVMLVDKRFGRPK